MDRILAKYAYKTYRELFKDREFIVAAARKGWIAPAVLPNTIALSHNYYIRKYLVLPQAINNMLRDTGFERIMCNAGFYGPACTTSTTSSTSTTTTTT